MKGKTVAFVILLVILAGSIFATSTTTTIIADLPTGLFEIFIGGIPMALADPVPGGGGTGGND